TQPELLEKPIGGSPLSILVVEDNVISQVMIKKVLTRWGHQVTIAKNGNEGLGHLKINSYDLVFMDVQLPYLDGLRLTQQVRLLESSLGKHTPIFALTSFVMKDDQARCLEAGMDGYLAKPLSLKRLNEILHQVCQARNLQETTQSAIAPQKTAQRHC
ncbi:MAG: response regulator, partial [Bdellovibrionales bacterium]|nr:response regulator [Bdellovibrionales bacterium]